LGVVLIAGVAVKILGKDRRRPGGAAQAGQNSGSGQGELGSIGLVHGLVGLVWFGCGQK